MSQFSLEGRIALVTGGGRGIGLGIATSLAQAGADVVIADYTKELAEAGAHEISKLGRRSAAILVDVRQPDSVTAMVDSVVKHFGRLDIAMNNAGIVSLGGIGELTVEQCDDCMAVNLRGVFLSTKAEVAVMRKQQFGRIINTASIAGKEIGRAACRGRGEISVVAVSLKKKNKRRKWRGKVGGECSVVLSRSHKGESRRDAQTAVRSHHQYRIHRGQRGFPCPVALLGAPVRRDRLSPCRGK